MSSRSLVIGTTVARASAVLAVVVLLIVATTSAAVGRPSAATGRPGAPGTAAETAGTPPHVFFYNLDDLRDAIPGQALDPLQFMPKLRDWMADGRRYTQTFVTDPACCPSRASLMTGRYPHNNGVRQQSQGPSFDSTHSLACYLQRRGYATYEAGKFLTTWPKKKLPPCFDHSSVIWGGYVDVAAKEDGRALTARGYSTTYLGQRGRTYIRDALDAGRTFYLYETPQAPHIVNVTLPDGTPDKLAVPDAKYADATVGACAGPPEVDRKDKPPYIRRTNETTVHAQRMCESQLRSIMTADDEFDATMRLLAERGVLDDTLVIFSSDNGFNWGEHGRSGKFVPYEPSVRVPLLVRWPGHIDPGTDSTRVTSYLDIMPTILQAADVTLPATAPAMDGESLLAPSTRTTMFLEYYKDPANGNMNTWKAVRTTTAKYIETYAESGKVVWTEYYDLADDPDELTNLLTDGNPRTPPPAQVTTLATRLKAFTACAGAGCVK